MRKIKLPEILKNPQNFLTKTDRKMSKKDIAAITLTVLLVASLVVALSDIDSTNAVMCGHGQHTNY